MQAHSCGLGVLLAAAALAIAAWTQFELARSARVLGREGQVSAGRGAVVSARAGSTPGPAPEEGAPA